MYMQQEEDVEMQIWFYLEGHGSEEERARIAVLIEKDPIWREGFATIKKLQDTLGHSLELDQPGMRFTQNVMEAVAKVQIAPTAKAYLNSWIIRGLAAFFIGGIAILLVQSFTHLSPSDDSIFSILNPGHYGKPVLPGSTLIYGFLFINVIAGLVLVDAVFKSKRHRTPLS